MQEDERKRGSWPQGAQVLSMVMHVKVYISAKLRQRRSWWIIGCYRHWTGRAEAGHTHTRARAAEKHSLVTDALRGPEVTLCRRVGEKCRAVKSEDGGLHWGNIRQGGVAQRAHSPPVVGLHGLSRKMVIIASTQKGFLGPVQIGAWFCHHWRNHQRGNTEGGTRHSHTRHHHSLPLSPSAPPKVR